MGRRNRPDVRESVSATQTASCRAEPPRCHGVRHRFEPPRGAAGLVRHQRSAVDHGLRADQSGDPHFPQS
jgi:hypothetical protein